MKFIKILTGFIFIVIIIAVFLYIIPDEQNEKKEIKKIKADSTENVVNVKAAEAKIGDLVQYVYTQGYAEALRRTPVILKIGGYIDKIAGENGQKVKKGEILLQLNNKEQQIALSEARTALIKSIIDFGVKVDNRDSAIAYVGKILNGNGEGSGKIQSDFSENLLKGNRRNEVLAVQSGLMDAYNKYLRAELNYSRTIFKAPFSGVIGDVKFKKSQWLQAGNQAAVLYDLSVIKFVAPVLEDDTPEIEQGAMAVLKISALPQNDYRAVVKEINPAIDAEKRMMNVGIYLSNKKYRIKPGMSARIQIKTKVYENRLLVPKEAVLIRDSRELVFIIRDSKAVWCYVKTGKKNDRFVEIVSSTFNLKAGEPVITEGHFSIAHGAKVSVQQN